MCFIARFDAVTVNTQQMMHLLAQNTGRRLS